MQRTNFDKYVEVRESGKCYKGEGVGHVEMGKDNPGAGPRGDKAMGPLAKLWRR